MALLRVDFNRLGICSRLPDVSWRSCGTLELARHVVGFGRSVRRSILDLPRGPASIACERNATIRIAMIQHHRFLLCPSCGDPQESISPAMRRTLVTVFLAVPGIVAAQPSARPEARAAQLAAAAFEQTRHRLTYDGSYRRIPWSCWPGIAAFRVCPRRRRLCSAMR